MSGTKSYGTRTSPVTDIRPLQRGGVQSTSPTMAPALPQPLRLPNGEKQGGVAPTCSLACDGNSQFLQQELGAFSINGKLNGVSVWDGGNSTVGSDVARDSSHMAPLSREEVHCALSVIIARQNAEWHARRHSLLKQRDCEGFCLRQPENGSESKKNDKLLQPLAMLLHSLLGESRLKWEKMLASRVHALRRELQEPNRAPSIGCSSGSDENEDEWSVGQLYHALLTGLNSAVTEELLTTWLFGGDTSICYDSIDSFGLLTVFRAPIQELLARCDVLAPSLTTLRRYFAALHPSNGSPRVRPHTEPSANVVEDNLEMFLQHGHSPEAVASALRGGVSPSLRRLLYARALQLPLVVTDGTPLFGGRGEFQGNQHSDGVAGCLSFASKHSRDKIRRRMHHSYPTKEHESLAKVVQAIIKVDNSQFVGNSDKYFIFLDETELLALSLLVDRSVLDMHLKNTLKQLGRPPEQVDSYLVYIDSFMKEGGPQLRTTTPSGFFPVRSCSMLIAPLCYVTGDTVEQYELLSALFGQLWCRLQGPTPELAQCCWLFEALVTRFAAPACLHATRTLRFPPLRLAIHWMLSGFVEVLEPAELLSFWDLILSYHVEEMFGEWTLLSLPVQEDADGPNKRLCAPCALWLLPLMAASLFVYRAPLVERCSTAEEMLLVFKEGHHIRSRPLLQYLLFMAK